eukprot:gene232-436_t
MSSQGDPQDPNRSLESPTKEDLLKQEILGLNPDISVTNITEVLKKAAQFNLYTADELALRWPEMASFLVTAAADDTVFQPEELSTKEALFNAAQPCSFDTYVESSQLNSNDTITAVAKHYIANLLSCGGFPTYKKPMVVTLCAILLVFPGFLAFLPTRTTGERWPDEQMFAVWAGAPVSKADAAYGAFMPYAKPYEEWKAMVTTGYNANEYDPASAAHMWSPITIYRAMLDQPAKLLGLVNPSALKVRVSLGNAIRKADWSVRRLLLLVPFYLFLQLNVVAVAFQLKGHPDPRAKLGNQCNNLYPITRSNTSVNVTEHVLAYTSYLDNPGSKTHYVSLVKKFNDAVDKHPHYQAHTFDSKNRATFLELIKAPLKPKDTFGSNATTSPSKTDPAVGISAGASARAIVSPGKPGASKAFKSFADVTRGAAVASTFVGTPGTSSAAMTAPATPAVALPITPAQVHGATPVNMANSGTMMPPGLGYAGHVPMPAVGWEWAR